MTVAISPRRRSAPRRVLAPLRRPRRRRAFLGRALDDATNAGLTPVEWEAHAALARLRRDQADTAAADEHQRRARAVVDTLAAAITDAGLRRCFLSRAETLLDRPPVR